MQNQGKNKQNFRNSLNVESLSSKIELRTLERIGLVLRKNNTGHQISASSLAKEPRKHKKRPGKKRKSLFHRRKLSRASGVNWSEAGSFAQDSKNRITQ